MKKDGLIRNKKSFTIGLVMLLSFALVYAGIMSPIFGNQRNGLQFADDTFNSLSKGSAYFIPDQIEKAQKQNGTMINVSISAPDSTVAANWGKLYTAAGADVKVEDSKVSISGDLGKILNSALVDCDAMYNNQGEKLSSKYGYDAREATYGWYNSLGKIDTALKNQENFKQAEAVNAALKKGVEPAYNYYGIEIKHVRDYKGTVTGMLMFYLIYTLWFGFSLYFLFEGLGITMTKSKKAEA